VPEKSKRSVAKVSAPTVRESSAAKKRKAPRGKRGEKVVHIGDIAIDSGQLVMADPCRMDETMAALAYELGPACHRSGELNMGTGVILPTGLGDGIYPVIACYGKIHGIAGRVSAIFVDFTNPMRGHGCEEPFPHDFVDDCYYGSYFGPQILPDLPKDQDGDGLVLNRIDRGEDAPRPTLSVVGQE
jgi:hypothetical protein